MPHLLVAISAHGFGHLAQVAPVLNQLHASLPGLRLTLRTALPRARLEERIKLPFALQAAADDFGMLQHNALELDLPASLQRYRELHDSWQHQVGRVRRELEAVGPDLLFADIPYLTLEAAHRAGIPSMAMCSLNWAQILRGCLPDDAEVAAIAQQMLTAYRRAERFLCPQPSMPMPGLDNVQPIGVLAIRGRNRRKDLIGRGLVGERERLVIVAMGGIAHRLPVERWPHRRDVRYVLPDSWPIHRDDCLSLQQTGIGFTDLLASAEAIITKPGYGTFTEATVNGLPILYVRRGNWPEESVLFDWIARNGRSLELTRSTLERGEHLPALEALLSQPPPPPVSHHGAAEAAEILRERLFRPARRSVDDGGGD
jgi:hypothetical protein